MMKASFAPPALSMCPWALFTCSLMLLMYKFADWFLIPALLSVTPVLKYSLFIRGALISKKDGTWARLIVEN